jgi:hypothetical protein
MVDVFIGEKPHIHVALRSSVMPLTLSLLCLVRIRIVIADLAVDFLAMVEVVCECRMHVGQRNGWNTGNYLVSRKPFLIPQGDILDANAMPCDKRSFATETRADFDVCRMFDLTHC